jgi:hypothetical protein
LFLISLRYSFSLFELKSTSIGFSNTYTPGCTGLNICFFTDAHQHTQERKGNFLVQTEGFKSQNLQFLEFAIWERSQLKEKWVMQDSGLRMGRVP